VCSRTTTLSTTARQVSSWTPTGAARRFVLSEHMSLFPCQCRRRVCAQQLQCITARRASKWTSTGAARRRAARKSSFSPAVQSMRKHRRLGSTRAGCAMSCARHADLFAPAWATSCKLAAQELWWETFGEPLPADGAMWRGPPPPAWASGPPPAPGAKLCLRAHRTRSRRVGRNIRSAVKTRNDHAAEISVRYCRLSWLVLVLC